MISNPRLEQALDLITRLASGRLDARAVLGGTYDDVDALLVGLNMLAEELEASMVSAASYKAKAQELADALERIHALEGMLPVCAWCKQVRDDKGYWSRIEDYLYSTRGTKVTHGMCPSCYDKFVDDAEDGSPGEAP